MAGSKPAAWSEAKVSNDGDSEKDDGGSALTFLMKIEIHQLTFIQKVEAELPSFFSSFYVYVIYCLIEKVKRSPVEFSSLSQLSSGWWRFRSFFVNDGVDNGGSVLTSSKKDWKIGDSVLNSSIPWQRK